MTVRGKLICMCACVAAIQLAAAAGHGWFSRRLSEHHAGTRGSHEELELLVQVEAGLVWQLKDLGDLIVEPGRAAETRNIMELLAAQKRIDDALEQLGKIVTKERGFREGERAGEELKQQASLIARVAALRTGVLSLAQAVRSDTSGRHLDRSWLEQRVTDTIAQLHDMIGDEKQDVVEQEEAAGDAAAWSSRVAWSAPLFSALALLTALGVVLRSISRALSDLARGATRVAGGDLEEPVPVRSRDELGRLAIAFNEMQLDLKRRIEERDRALRDARFRVVSETAPVAIAEVDGAGRVFYVNRRWLELTGSQAGSTTPWTDLVHGDDRLRVTRLQLDGGGAPEEMRVVRGDAAAVWVIAQMARLGGDSADRYIVALADITAQKKAIARAEQLSRELMTVSRKAGMAEVSAGVLHNVGNVLSSVLVSATTLGELLHQSRVAGLVKATSLLDERRDDLPAFLASERGKLVVPYLVQIAGHLAGDLEDAQGDLARIEKGIEHIRVIIASQQTYAKATAMSEELRMSDLLEEVLGLNSSRFDKHDVRVVRRFEDDPTLISDRHKTMQILINLIGNALQALNEVYPAADPEARATLTITTRMTPAGNLAVEVADNGVGIAPDNLGRIFEFGFTTRKDGHGFGLHSSALTARDLGGSLRVASEGLGRGATFILELPVPAIRQVERSA